MRHRGAPRALIALFLGVLTLPTARAADLPPAVSQALQDAGIPARSVGIVCLLYTSRCV